MSNARVKAESSAAKDARQGIVEQRPASGSKSHKGKKPYQVLGTFWRWKDYSIGNFATLADAEKCVAVHLKRKDYSDLRIIRPGVKE